MPTAASSDRVRWRGAAPVPAARTSCNVLLPVLAVLLLSAVLTARTGVNLANLRTLTVKSTAAAVPLPLSLSDRLQRVEREAAAEIDARIAALPDEPSRTLKSLLGELFQEVFDEARPAGEKLSASIIKVEEELGDEVWSRGQMVGDGSLLERVRMLREIVGLE